MTISKETLFTTIKDNLVKTLNGKLQVQVSHPDKPVSACCN